MNQCVLSVSRYLIPAFVTACWATASLAQGAPPFVTGQPAQVTVTNPATSPVPNKVVNPATAPVITSSIDNPARIPYAASGEAGCSIQCTIAFPAVPAGHRLVVQYLTGFVGLTSAPQSVLVAAGADEQISYFIAPSAIGNQGAFSAFVQPVLMYVNAGQTFGLSLQATGTQFRTVMAITVTGYLVDCAANQCAPIAPPSQ